MDRESLIALTADIVSAHVANNNVAIADLAPLVQQVHAALAKLGRPDTAPPEAEKTPIVSVRASVKPDYLVCMECGTKHKMLRRHLKTAHGITPDQYRADHGLPRDYPMIPPNYSKARRAIAQQIGLGRLPRAASKPKRARRDEGMPEGA